MADDGNEPNNAGTETQRGTEVGNETQSRIPQKQRGHVIDDISVLSMKTALLELLLVLLLHPCLRMCKAAGMP